MDNFKSYLKSSLLLPFGTAYVVIAWIAVLIVRVIVDANNLLQMYITAAIGFAVCNCALVFSALYAIEAAPLPDRKLVFTRTVISIFPTFVVFNFLGTKLTLYSGMSNELQFSISSWITNILFLALLTTVVTTWGLIYGPFARASLLKKAQNPEAAMRALYRLHWPLTFEEGVDLEIRITPKLFYSFFAAIGGVIFIILETVVSELLSNTFGLVGYISPSIVALSMALVLYPIHKRMRRYVAPQSDNPPDSGVDDARSLAIELGNSMRKLMILWARFWCFFLLVAIVSVLSAHYGWLDWFFMALLSPIQY